MWTIESTESPGARPTVVGGWRRCDPRTPVTLPSFPVQLFVRRAHPARILCSVALTRRHACGRLGGRAPFAPTRLPRLSVRSEALDFLRHQNYEHEASGSRYPEQ